MHTSEANFSSANKIYYCKYGDHLIWIILLMVQRRFERENISVVVFILCGLTPLVFSSDTFVYILVIYNKASMF